MLSNSKWVKVAYLNQNIELNILSYISFLHYKSQKNKIFEVVFPRKVLNQRIHFAVLMLKSSFNFLGATMKSQKWSKSDALGLNYTFEDGLAEYYTVCPNKCILKSFKFLANNLDIHFTWTHCILMITF